MEAEKADVGLQLHLGDNRHRNRICHSFNSMDIVTDPLSLPPPSAPDEGTRPDLGDEDFATVIEKYKLQQATQTDGDTDDIVILKKERIVDTCDEIDVENDYACINSGKSTTIFPRPPLISTVNLMDTKYCSFQDRSCCSNCYKKISYESRGKKFADILCNRKSKTGKEYSLTTGQRFGVTVLEALEVIFELQIKTSVSEIILDEVEYVMCWKCCSILSKLYELYIEFAECSRPPSYIKSIMSHNKSLNAHHNMSQKCNIDASQRNEDEDEDDGPHLNFEVSFLEEDDSYSPPGETWARSASTTHMEVVRTRNLRKRSGAPQQYIKEEHEHDTDSSNRSATPPIKRGRGRPRRIPMDVKPLSISIKRAKDKRREKDRRLLHKCKECSIRFSRPSRLRRHANVHSERKYVCSVCDAGFKFPIYLARHEATHATDKGKDDSNEISESDLENEKKVHKLQLKVNRVKRKLTREDRRRAHLCRHCGLVFTKSSGLAHHARVHKSTTYACDQSNCSKEFKSKDILDRHKFKVHEITVSEGEVEDQKPSLRKIIKRRISDEENDEFYSNPKGGKQRRKYKCAECPQKFSRSDHMKRHAKVHVEKNNFCDTCLAGFATLKHLEAHINVQHAGNIDEDTDDDSEREGKRAKRPRLRIYKTLTCPQPDCDLTFTRTNRLKLHLISKHNIESSQPEEPQTCPVCSLVVKSHARLEIHLQKHRPLIRSNNYECDLCGKKYRDANNLRNHKASHRLDKPYVCDKCGFATKRSYQLTRHIDMVHVGVRSHLCNECGVSFKKKQHLRDHELTHNAMEFRPFTCTIEGCTKAYRSRRNLRQHLESHTGCRFQCETCGRIFTRKDNLKVHVDTVHLGKPGRTKKEKPKGDERTTPVKRTRKPKQPVTVAMEHIVHILPDSGQEVIEAGTTHQVMIVEESNLHQLQQQQQHQHFHHIIASPRLIQQATIAGQSVVSIPNAFGEFFYTI